VVALSLNKEIGQQNSVDSKVRKQDHEPGQRVPSTRCLASEPGISRIPVLRRIRFLQPIVIESYTSPVVEYDCAE
jgi:hypothetical protein